MRWILVLFLVPGVMGACLPGPGVPRELSRGQLGESTGSGPGQYQGSRWARLVLRSLTQQLWELGAPGEARRTDRGRSYPKGHQAFEYRSRAPVHRAFFLTVLPVANKIEKVFSGHCRPRGGPRPGRAPDGSRRVTYRGIEPRSGSQCVLHVDSDAGRHWRFRIVLSRRPRQ